ncbi:protein FATTY ACID EXPORT 1, chloroplastic [Sesamum alatum]|uniref:Protein FATTY ACID EXPORT 1, chloroplastic n=1 Tax=Sesamum alatum TaxID=300844 RepID=A0AAE1YKW1_9LAMI|nr:protein FATTY ACID EXPORT 1, chloroplastic [Sesamum alatum]
MSSAILQLSLFSSVVNNRRRQLHPTPYPYPTKFQPGKVLNVMNSDGHGTKLSDLEKKTTPSYLNDASQCILEARNNHILFRKVLLFGEASNGHVKEEVVSQPKRAAKIHDFCLGIPFGGLVFGGGLVGFIFSRSPVTLTTGVLFGGALLALSTLSLKVWRQGNSSFPFILGQAVLSVALLWKNFQAYSLTKKLFPTGFNIVTSAAMLCFYSYVVISGGNPPPKKLKTSTPVASS